MKTQFDTPEQFIERCIAAIGGLAALHQVRSLKISARRTTYNQAGAPLTTTELRTYRAAGGRIRTEERTTTHTFITVVNGLAGRQMSVENETATTTIPEKMAANPLTPSEVEVIKRGVRLYPRNFLAHAGEFHFIGPVPVKDDGRLVLEVELPTENVCFGFDGETLRCRWCEDRTRGIVTEFEDYRWTGNILTPFMERRRLQERLYQEEAISTVEYNLPLDEALFQTT